MATAARIPVTAPQREEDERVFLHGVSWALYEELDKVRGDKAVPRLTYLEGELELMSPSGTHENIGKMIARLVEAYGDEMGLSLNGYKSWTLKKSRKKRGCEPDECYYLGTTMPKMPELAIEVNWTRGGLDKLEVYRGLGVREVWIWQDDRIVVHLLQGERYAISLRSAMFPKLDLGKVAELSTAEDQSGAVRAFRASLRGKPRR